jgi:hypothetical protein
MNQNELNKKLERLGFLLKDHRENLFISAVKVSRDTGLNRNTIANCDKGKGVISSFILYAEYLRLELSLKKKEIEESKRSDFANQLYEKTKAD